MVVPRNPKNYKPPQVKSRTRFYSGFILMLFAFAMMKNNEYPPYLFVALFGIGGFIFTLSSFSAGTVEIETKVIH